VWVVVVLGGIGDRMEQGGSLPSTLLPCLPYLPCEGLDCE
jgi:hypothetical protein